MKYMDVFNVTNLKSAVLFDATAIDPTSNKIKRLARYGLGLQNFISNGKVRKSYLKMPEDAQADDVNLQMKITRKPISEVLPKMISKRVKLLVAFGHVEEILQTTQDAKLKYKIIVTDDDVTRYNLKALRDDLRIIPGRLLFYLYDAFWWRCSPFEMIEKQLLQVDMLPDRTLNELALAGQKALKCHQEGKEEECMSILEKILLTYPDHIPTLFIIAALGITKLQNNSVFGEDRQITNDNVANSLIRATEILQSLPPATNANSKALQGLVTKLNVLGLQALQVLEGDAHTRLSNSLDI